MKAVLIAAMFTLGLTATANAALAFVEIEDGHWHGVHQSGRGPSPYDRDAFRRYWNAQPHCHFDAGGGLFCPRPLL